MNLWPSAISQLAMDCWRSTIRMLYPLVFLLVLAGCTQTLLIFGSPPRADQLDTLRLGESTKADVLLALGQPQGEGVARLPTLSTSQAIWSYDYTEAKLNLEWSVSAKVIDLNVLLVFFDHDKYDGYLWLSSTPALQKSQ